MYNRVNDLFNRKIESLDEKEKLVNDIEKYYENNQDKQSTDMLIKLYEAIIFDAELVKHMDIDIYLKTKDIHSYYKKYFMFDLEEHEYFMAKNNYANLMNDVGNHIMAMEILDDISNESLGLFWVSEIQKIMTRDRVARDLFYSSNGTSTEIIYTNLQSIKEFIYEYENSSHYYDGLIGFDFDSKYKKLKQMKMDYEVYLVGFEKKVNKLKISKKYLGWIYDNALCLDLIEFIDNPTIVIDRGLLIDTLSKYGIDNDKLEFYYDIKLTFVTLRRLFYKVTSGKFKILSSDIKEEFGDELYSPSWLDSSENPVIMKGIYSDLFSLVQKISVYFNEKYNLGIKKADYGKIGKFGNIKNFNYNSKYAIAIFLIYKDLSDEDGEYKHLVKLRNDIYHNYSATHLYGDDFVTYELLNEKIILMFKLVRKIMFAIYNDDCAGGMKNQHKTIL